MLQARRDLDLPQEPFGPEADCDVRMEHLDRHRAVVSQVLSQIHSCHASPADLALDLVAAGYRGSEATEELYHAYLKLHARAPSATHLSHRGIVHAPNHPLGAFRIRRCRPLDYPPDR